MFCNLLTCALLLGTPAPQAESEAATIEYSEVKRADSTQVEAEPVINEKFWARKRAMHLGYEVHHFQNEAGGEIPAKLGVGYATVRNVWLHKKPIARMMKLAIDHGATINYTLFDSDLSTEDYNGPSGYLGSESLSDEGGLPFDLKSLGSHYFSVGYAVGLSLTINPVAQLRVNGYCHFVPSFAIQFSGGQTYAGFMPYMRYGCEVGYGRVGVGVEWGTGMSKMTDLMSKLNAETDNFEVPKSKFYSNYMKIYLSIRMGKVKK